MRGLHCYFCNKIPSFAPRVQIVLHTYCHGVCTGSACLPRATPRSTQEISWKRARSTSGMPQINPRLSSLFRSTLFAKTWLTMFLAMYFFPMKEAELNIFLSYIQSVWINFLCNVFNTASSAAPLKLREVMEC
jgi:hypothetical protein